MQKKTTPSTKAKPVQARARGRPRAFYDKSGASHIKAIERAVKVLKIVSDSEGLSLSEISDQTGETASTIYRILITLEKDGLVEFIENGQLWQVGVEAFRIGNAFMRRTSIVERSRPVMQRVMEETDETANLAVIDGAEVVFVSQVETHQPIRAFFRPGTRGQVHASGIGKAILAFMPDQQIKKLIRETQWNAYTDKTITDERDLLNELSLIRENGWSVDNEERTEGMRCIAAPIFNSGGDVIAGISVSGPSVRVHAARERQLGELIKNAAAEVTEAIGGSLPSTL